MEKNHYIILIYTLYKKDKNYVDRKDYISVVCCMLHYVGVRYLLNNGFTYNRRKKRPKDIIKQKNLICLLSPCKGYRFEFYPDDKDYIKIMICLL